MIFFITGATGFIGRHVCASLTRQNHTVVAMLRRPEAQLDTLRQPVSYTHLTLPTKVTG